MHRPWAFFGVISTISVVCIVGVLLSACTSRKALPNPDLAERARTLASEVPLIDGHNDLPWQYRQKANRDMSRFDLKKSQPDLMTDIARLRSGGVGGQFWSVYVPTTMKGADAVQATIEQIDIVHQLALRYSETFALARTPEEIRARFKEGKIASLIGVEGGHSINNSLAVLRMFFDLGARYMTLTHSTNTDWADSSTDTPRARGLTRFGEQVVGELNRLGMLVDLSHVSPETMNQVLDIAKAPVIFSHSSARALCNHPRNVPDDVLKRLPSNGGIVMVTFVPGFIAENVRLHELNRQNEAERLKAMAGSSDESVSAALIVWDQQHPAPRAKLAQVVDHIDHIRVQAGIDAIGLGSDFDGITSTIEGLEDVSRYPALAAELLRRGYSDEDVKKIMGLNLLRVFEKAAAEARQLRTQRPFPSAAVIEETDGKAKP